MKYGIAIGAGVIDQDFRGTIKVILFNHNQKEPFKIAIGDRVAQLIIEQVKVPEIQVVDSLVGTERGEKGFGSTGK